MPDYIFLKNKNNSNISTKYETTDIKTISGISIGDVVQGHTVKRFLIYLDTIVKTIVAELENGDIISTNSNSFVKQS